MNRPTFLITTGMTGVGKTSVIKTAIANSEKEVSVLSYGTILLEEAQNRELIDTRDEITELDADVYDELQDKTAEAISDMVSSDQNSQIPDSAREIDATILDTHATLDTPYGYRPGLSEHDVKTLNPDQFVFIEATAEEIRSRRQTDESRNRDIDPVKKISEQQEVAKQMATAFAAIGRCPIKFLENPDGELQTTANEYVPLLENR